MKKKMSDDTNTTPPPDPDFSSLLKQLDDNTNGVANRLASLIQQLADANTKRQSPTHDQLQQLQAIVDHLRGLGADPANPIPQPSALATLTP